jgi:hypothetical protein
MLQLFPFSVWLAAATSVVMLAMLVAAGDLRSRSLIAFVAWFLVAAGCQFAGRSAGLVAAGLALQTLLAVALIVRWRLSG